jgi:Bcr/CflA subfamily drug resistance transporter
MSTPDARLPSLISPWIARLLTAYNFTTNLANDIYLPSMPVLVKVFATSTSVLQLTMTAWFAGVALPQLFFGPLTDRFGRRPILFVGGLFFLLATATCLFTHNILILILARFFQGIGVSSLNVTTFGILADLYEYKIRGKIMNKISMCGTVAPLIGPVLGGYILLYFGWRMNFLLIFMLAVISIVGLWLELPESNLYKNPHALNLKNIYKNYYLLLHNPGFLKHLIPYCLLLAGLVVYLTAAPFIIIGQFKINVAHFGYTQLPIFCSLILGALLYNRLDDEAQIKRYTKLGMSLVLCAGCTLLGTAVFFGNNLYCFLASMMVYAFGFSLCGSTLVNEVMSASTLSRGSAAAFLGFSMAVCCTLGSLMLGLIYNGRVISMASILFVLTLVAFTRFFYQSATSDSTTQPDVAEV